MLGSIGRLAGDSMRRWTSCYARSVSNLCFFPCSSRRSVDISDGAIPYAVLYIDREDAVWVVAVMHFKRKPGYWARRIG